MAAKEAIVLKEFREFAMKGNMLDLAVGLILGAAFGAIIASLVKDVLMPPIGLALGGMDFANLFVVLKAGAENAGPYASVDAATKAGAVTLNWGLFVNALINFLIVAFSMFMVVKAMNRFKKQAEEAPAAPPRQEVLLEEIRDALVTKG